MQKFNRKYAWKVSTMKVRPAKLTPYMVRKQIKHCNQVNVVTASEKVNLYQLTLYYVKLHCSYIHVNR